MHMSPEVESLLKKARNFSDARDWLSALDAFDALLAADSRFLNDANCVHDRALCLFHIGRKAEALSALDKAVEIDPGYSYRYASRAWMRNANGDIHGAIADYKQAIALDPDDAICHNNLGLLEEQLGYKSQADERFAIADELAGILKERGIHVEEATDAWEDEQPDCEQETSWVKTIADALFTKKGRQEFLQFIRNGFKL